MLLFIVIMQGWLKEQKKTKFGLVILAVGPKKLVFTANSSVQNQLISLESKQENPFTARILKTEMNQRLLENNPVAADTLNSETNYVEQQQEFFSKIAQSSNFQEFVHKVFPQATEARTPLTREQYLEVTGKYFTQLYFQALFSKSDYKDPQSFI